MTEEPKPRTKSQNDSIHLGCQQMADTLTENGKSLKVFLEHLDVRPTKEALFAIFRAIAVAKYQNTTSQLTRGQIDPIWEEMAHALAITTGVRLGFPSQETIIQIKRDEDNNY